MIILSWIEVVSERGKERGGARVRLRGRDRRENEEGESEREVQVGGYLALSCSLAAPALSAAGFLSLSQKTASRFFRFNRGELALDARIGARQRPMLAGWRVGRPAAE